MDFKGMSEDVMSVAEKVKADTARRIAIWGVEALGCAGLVALIWWAYCGAWR
jgi:hypothetical protein